MSAKLTVSQLKAYAVDSIRDLYHCHLENIRAADLVDKQAFAESVSTYLEVHREAGVEDLPRSMGRNTAFALYRELMAYFNAWAAEGYETPRRILAEVDLERSRIALEAAQVAHSRATQAITAFG